MFLFLLGVQWQSGAMEHRIQELSYVAQEGEDEREGDAYQGKSTGRLRSPRAAWKCGKLDGPTECPKQIVANERAVFSE